jgi:hypothetical protein
MKEKRPEPDPIMTIGRYRIRKSLLENYLENVTENGEFNLFDNPRSNKMTGTWIKNNLGKIVKAVGPVRHNR